MVNERPAIGGTEPDAQPHSQSQPAPAPLGEQRRQKPSTAPVAALSNQPQFGQASPLTNRLKPQPNIFNPNSKRPEHHRPNPPAFYRPGQKPSVPAQPSFQQRPQQPTFGPSSREGFYLPGQKRQNVPAASTNAAISADFFEISRPTNPPARTIAPAPKPTFSSLGPKTTFLPFNHRAPGAAAKPIVIDDDDEFDPDAAFKDERFGAVDPYMYIDPSKAGEDIKALLEGAFDDDEDRPKTSLRNRARKTTADGPKKHTLADKLAQLDVKDKEAAKSSEENMAEDEDEEDGTVEGMAVKLLPHQVEGVSWMLDKEIGERKKNGVLPKGGILADDMGLGKTIQSVTLILTNPRPALEAKAPENTKRKMPGKEVGKGTLVIAPLALIKQWEAEIKTRVSRSHALKVLVHHGSNRTKSHLELKKYDVVITTYQIIASEHASSSDHDEGVKAGCFGVHWYRIILDEAHSIKNSRAKSTQACCALKSWYRWCLTGTPMQNNLDELQSLIHFLRIKPYNDISHWKAQIAVPLKNGKGQIAIKRVQYFLKAFMKRRTKDILKQEGALNFGGKKDADGTKSQGMKIVKREIESVVCELDGYEREFYDKLAQRANDRLQDMMGAAKTDYIGALVLLLRLRQACNHPQLIKSAMAGDKDALATAGIGGSQSPRKAAANDDIDDLADLLGGLEVKTKNCDVCQVKLESEQLQNGSVRCADCEADLSMTESKQKAMAQKSASSKVKPKPKPRVARRIIADSSDEDGDDNSEGEGDWLVSPSQQQISLGTAGGADDENADGGGDTLGSIDTITDSDDSDSEVRVRRPGDRSTRSRSNSSSSTRSTSLSAAQPSPTDSTSYPSTKIRHLLRILTAETPAHKVIVFSQFTTMLNLIEPHLSAARIPFVRYDGSLANPVREAALAALRSDPAVRVLLCSLKCGSLGLNLTAASRVVIVEPFWNPFVEEQAIDRVHRLNQTVDVKVYKLTVKESVEERILELQEKKRELAKAAIEGGKTVGKLSMRDLLGLFGGSLDAAADGEGRLSTGSAAQTGRLSSGVGRDRPGDRGTVAAQSSQGQRQGVADGRRQERSGRGRISNEDPVYGRR